MANRTVLEILGKSNRLTLGPLIRGAGIPVPCYPDLRGALSNPENLRNIAKACAVLVKKWDDVQLIGGCSMGGVPLATAISLETGIPMVILRKRKRSNQYSSIDGLYKRGQRVLLVDDSIVTGSSHKLFIEGLELMKLEPIRLLTILNVEIGGVDWQANKRKWLLGHGIQLDSLATWSEWALFMRDKGKIPKKTVETILSLMERPPEWANK